MLTMTRMQENRFPESENGAKTLAQMERELAFYRQLAHKRWCQIQEANETIARLRGEAFLTFEQLRSAYDLNDCLSVKLEGYQKREREEEDWAEAEKLRKI